jgi:hypothetical protein
LLEVLIEKNGDMPWCVALLTSEIIRALPAKRDTLLPCVEQGGCRTQGAF